MKAKVCLTALGLLLALAVSGAAMAEEPLAPSCAPGCYGGGFSGYWGFSELYPPQHLLNRLPHYALFPPVYYSVPIPRTYGYSPFAYPPGFTTPPAPPPEPLVIQNPYVPKADAPQPDENKVTVSPLRVRNPYVGEGIAGLASQ